MTVERVTFSVVGERILEGKWGPLRTDSYGAQTENREEVKERYQGRCRTANRLSERADYRGLRVEMSVTTFPVPVESLAEVLLMLEWELQPPQDGGVVNAASPPPVPAVLVIGNPIDGFGTVGPFGNGDEAAEYGRENEGIGDEWWVQPLHAPAEPS